MTPLEKITRALERDAKLRGEATKGPWEHWSNVGVQCTTPSGRPSGPPLGEGHQGVKCGGISNNTVGLLGPDCAFIAHARNVDLGSCLRIAVEALARHRAFGIYDECGHDHCENDTGVVMVEELDRPYTCKEGLQYQVCEACDTDDGTVNEHTEDGEWPCREYLALAQIAALLPDEEGR